MENRFDEAPTEAVNLMNKTATEMYPGADFMIKVIFDSKQRKRKGKVVVATTEVVTEKLRFFLEEDDVSYDFLTIIDAVAWEFANDKDKLRLIRHELAHMFITETGKMQVVAHDVSDFYEEIKLNADDAEWSERLTTVVESVYEEEKE